MTVRNSWILYSLRSRWLLALLLLAGLCRVGWADPVAPGPNDAQITAAVVSLLSRQHLSHHPLDQEISQRCLKSFLKALDPMKMYFYQADVDEFMQNKDQLSEAVRRGDVSFAYTVFRRYLQRVDEGVNLTDQLLTERPDFTVDEEMVIDRDTAQYPRDLPAARDSWRKRIKYDLLTLEADKKIVDKKAYYRLVQRYHSFAKQMHQVDSDELLEIYLNSFTTAFDPHTDYMSPDAFHNFEIAMSLEVEGIGALLTGQDGYTTVKHILPGGSAEKNGQLKADDKIIGVGQAEAGEMVNVIDMKLSKVVKLIRGQPGTIVRLDVVSGDDTQRKLVKIVRQKIALKDSVAKVFEAGRKPDGTPYRIGVIDVPSFYRDMGADRRGVADFKSATRDVANLLMGFRRQNVDAVVLDLRYNGGGSLPEAVSLTGLFTGAGPIVQIKDANGRTEHLDDNSSGVVWPGPLVVLINKYSASASEILAGAIQDYGRGLIVGDHSTHGKGTVQSLVDLGQQFFRVFANTSSYGALKITLQQFYRPNGDSTQKRGVLADVELPSLTTHRDTGEADLDYPVEFDRIAPAQYRYSNFVNPAICDQLRQLSQQRLLTSEKFQEVTRNVARYKEQKAKKFVTLNREKFLKLRAELNADKVEEDAIEKHSELNDGVIERDYYLDEALTITTDYLNLQHVAGPQQAAGARQ
jgi:carboxyl-terminal processing protease